MNSSAKKSLASREGFCHFHYFLFFCKKIGILISCSFGACTFGVVIPGNAGCTGVTGVTGTVGATGAAGFTGVVILAEAP